jgi:phytoene dehydrogenase-like protein
MFSLPGGCGARHYIDPGCDNGSGAEDMQVTAEFDVIVVGAGHNGLTAAAYLARAGLRVLVLERRTLAGGCAVTEEVDPRAAPGCRVSTASYIASMLRPEVIRDLELARHGLRMVACEPGVQIVLPDGVVVPWWSDSARCREALARHSARDAQRFLALEAGLKSVARHLEPFFMEPPPHLHAAGAAGWRDLWRLWRRFGGMSGAELEALARLLTGSLGDLLEREFESDAVRRLVLANSTYGRHGGPRDPGSALGLLFHLLSGGEQHRQGFAGHVIGGMGAITQAMAAACRARGVEIRTGAPVARIDVRGGRACGVTLEDGTQLASRLVVSNCDPRRTFLALLERDALDPAFRRDVECIRMAGPAAKVNYVLDREPAVRGMPATHSPGERSLFTLVPALQDAQAGYLASARGELPRELWVDCVLASNVDETLAPAGRHMLTCFVQFVPYRLRSGTWDARRDELGDRVVRRIGEHVPGFADTIVARQVLTPLDLERRFGLTEGNIFHGDLGLDQLFFMRPLPGWSQYATPVQGLYLCGAGTHPGGGVTGAPGHNAARRVLGDLRRI